MNILPITYDPSLFPSALLDELCVGNIEVLNVLEVVDVSVLIVAGMGAVHVPLWLAEAWLLPVMLVPFIPLVVADDDKDFVSDGNTVTRPPSTDSPEAVGLTVTVTVTQTV